ncbi:MAG TPA: ATP-binding protein [Candidatus Binatia bacterium]|nr:ATP-binding protein [Candidatus Binatia bacterium]
MAVTDSPTYALIVAGAYCIPGLVWAVLAQVTWPGLRDWKTKTAFFRLLPILSGCAALLYALMAVLALVPAPLHHAPPPPLRVFYVVFNFSHFALAAVGIHVVRVLPLREEPPGRTWLTANYGIAALLASFVTYLALVGAPTSVATIFVIRNSYVVAMLALIVRQLARYVRRGGWRPGGLADVRTTDLVLLVGGVVGALGWVALAVTRPMTTPVPPWLVAYDVAVGLALAAPLAVRVLGEVVRRFLVVATMTLVAGAIYVSGRTVVAFADPERRALLDAGMILLLVLAFVPGQAFLREAIDYLLFRRTRRRQEALQTCLHGLSPELGRTECCRLALAELVRVLQLRGAAIVFDDEAAPVVAGALAADGIARVWPRSETAAPFLPGALLEYELRKLPDPLRDALIAAQVVAIVPIASRRRSWGHLFITAGFLGATGGDEDVRVVQAFADGLARVLDTAELVARTVAVERSLAHAEKLAAIGELAARIAHEIRNPVTAARSLAQQLAREPAAPFAAEHELILAELERVERQVAALLRFARREDFRFAPVDLGALVRETIDGFRSRLAAGGVALQVDAAPGITARADAEKLRQVVVNLVENAIDALEVADGTRRLTVTVGRANGAGVVSVRDTGGGVPADAIPHLFEPFFSLKAHGTGLGLAIAKRTIEAHGGRIVASAPAGTGMVVDVELPLAGRG